MAGPLSSEEIEDVVSSVRRLVSNEQRPRNPSRDLTSERLLLTPALRVVHEVGPLAPLVLDAPVVDAARESEGEGTDSVVTDLSPMPDMASGLTEAQEDSLAKALDLNTISDLEISEAELAGFGQPDGSLNASDATEAEWEDEVWAEAGFVSLGEAALAAEEAEVLPEQVSSEWIKDEPIPFIPLRRRAENLAARLAAGEVADTPDDSAKAIPADNTYVSPQSEQDPSVARATVPSAEMTTEFLDEDGNPLAVLDEAALQDIVRQTLRQELQGELGERITRNVRKLVRAEINRALMARDLD